MLAPVTLNTGRDSAEVLHQHDVGFGLFDRVENPLLIGRDCKTVFGRQVWRHDDTAHLLGGKVEALDRWPRIRLAVNVSKYPPP